MALRAALFSSCTFTGEYFELRGECVTEDTSIRFIAARLIGRLSVHKRVAKQFFTQIETASSKNGRNGSGSWLPSWLSWGTSNNVKTVPHNGLRNSLAAEWVVDEKSVTLESALLVPLEHECCILDSPLCVLYEREDNLPQDQPGRFFNAGGVFPSGAPPSFRTPYLRVDYFVIITVGFEDRNIWKSLRLPLRVVASLPSRPVDILPFIAESLTVPLWGSTNKEVHSPKTNGEGLAANVLNDSSEGLESSAKVQNGISTKEGAPLDEAHNHAMTLHETKQSLETVQRHFDSLRFPSLYTLRDSLQGSPSKGSDLLPPILVNVAMAYGAFKPGECIPLTIDFACPIGTVVHIHASIVQSIEYAKTLLTGVPTSSHSLPHSGKVVQAENEGNSGSSRSSSSSQANGVVTRVSVSESDAWCEKLLRWSALLPIPADSSLEIVSDLVRIHYVVRLELRLNRDEVAQPLVWEKPIRVMAPVRPLESAGPLRLFELNLKA